MILVASVIVGMETYRDFHLRHATFLHLADQVVLWIFAVEIALKMVARSPQPWLFFSDGWNVFDFVIVAACFIQVGEASTFVPVLRLVRILRVFRLVTALPRLQLIVGALLKAIPSMGYIVLLLGLHFYMFAVAAVFFFGLNDPWHFGDLDTAMLSLFGVVTLEGWTDLMYIQIYGSDNYGYSPEMISWVADHGFMRVSTMNPVLGAVFFIGFIVSGAMIILNLFVGVIMSGMDEARNESETAQLLLR